MSLTLCFALEGFGVIGLLGFGVVGLLGFGVVGLLGFGVVGLLDREPVRRSGNRYGETDRLSSIHVKKIVSLNSNDHINEILKYHAIVC
jgi:hypothetical protein